MSINITRGYNKTFIAYKLLKTTFYGEEYQNNYLKDPFEMSYFCRAFNITQYGKTKQQNRIKNRYKKYKNIPGIDSYFIHMIQSFYPGFPWEYPTMDVLLEKYKIRSETVHNLHENVYDNSYGQTPANNYNSTNTSQNYNMNNTSDSTKNVTDGFNNQKLTNDEISLISENNDHSEQFENNDRFEQSENSSSYPKINFNFVNIIGCMIFMCIGLGSMKNGGSPIVGFIFFAIGLACLISFNIDD
jgi:lipopolysaccharide export LptBFGC system permease protein LptF